MSLAPEEVSGSRDAGPESAACTVSVRTLCEFAAKSGDLDLRFTPSPTAQQGREGHALVASRRGPEHESEVSLSGGYLGLRVRDHIWVGSKAEWDEIGDDGRQHPQAYQG